MDLTNENVKKLRGLIVFTAVIVVCLWKYEATLEILPVYLRRGDCIRPECSDELYTETSFSGRADRKKQDTEKNGEAG